MLLAQAGLDLICDVVFFMLTFAYISDSTHPVQPKVQLLL
jgi:hypothetical protein